jgi:hypothetical protein
MTAPSYEAAGLCSCHTCTCAGCPSCTPVIFRPLTDAELAAQVDPWAEVSAS